MVSERQARRRSVLGALGTAGLAALAGCSASARSPSGGRFRLGTLQPPVTLDPIEARHVGSERAIGEVFDGLYAYGEGTDVVPRIASGPPTRDERGRVVVEIDDAARFQNGRPVTAEDVRYSFEAPVAEDAPTRGEASMIDAVETVDDRTVRFSLTHPYPALERVLTRPVVPKAEREAKGEAFAGDPVGAGPFEVRSFAEEKRVVLDRWDGYWGDARPAVETLTMVYVESPLTQLQGLTTDRIDAIEPVSPEIRPNVESVSGATVERREGFRSYYLGFNCNEGPTTDPTVREAIARCVGLDRAVSAFVEPMGERAYSVLPPQVARKWGMPREEWRSMLPSKDTARARSLFERAGETGRLEILTSMDPKAKEFGGALAGGLREAGQPALVTSVPWKTYLERSVTGAASDYAVFVGQVAGTPDPDSFVYPVFHENVQGLTNGIFYNEEEVMNAILAARRTDDRSKRRERYAEALTRLARERVYLPVCSFAESVALDRGVRNFRVHPIASVNPRLAGPNGVVRVDG